MWHAHAAGREGVRVCGVCGVCGVRGYGLRLWAYPVVYTSTFEPIFCELVMPALPMVRFVHVPRIRVWERVGSAEWASG